MKSSDAGEAASASMVLPRACPVCGVMLVAGEDPSLTSQGSRFPLSATPPKRASQITYGGARSRAGRLPPSLPTSRISSSSGMSMQGMARDRTGWVRRQAACWWRACLEAEARHAAEAALKANGSATTAAEGGAGAGGGGPGSRFERLVHHVPAEGVGQRATGWARKHAWPRKLTTKKQAAQAFKEHRVLLGGVPVEETRCLRQGDVLELLHDLSQPTARSPQVGQRRLSSSMPSSVRSRSCGSPLVDDRRGDFPARCSRRCAPSCRRRARRRLLRAAARSMPLYR